MIRLSGVSRTFGGRSGSVEALRRIDLDVAEGEFLAVVGRSGCGKSTLLRLVAGLLPVTEGEIRVADEVVTRPRRDIAMVFQRPALLPWRSVLDNVMLPTEIFGWSKAAHRDRARELLSMVGLSEFEKRLPHELSGGMQQRVSLCRALIQQPKVLLMDEPFSALDALTREELSVELQRIHMEHSATIVFVTHSIDEAVLLADRVVVLSPRPGQIRKVLDINIPRPRSLGRNAHFEDVARASAELHELLIDHPESGPGLALSGSGQADQQR
ncbi:MULTISPECIES: ABC transporter ATP-binding protein [unclassified Plantactinospora]|uniref:ABC transporter ATP-binding protein n=1 Tax=unclassified Plantactinospora TaxID=2631981 RepID=UPI000D168F36|nr:MULTISPECIES: ABC transporter ATP-binding protein [unclassified Plantactinospora]AVT33429.1 nitrate/sulfonate/bicarbonate ABC transporter ATP-binding protein [Plantactinospora sp. BC1]AVT39055.1 nitrate/sulfonate/bicarbonate ABC transporter ATP-binding protein [Plantactinospora sp. BB1]